MRPVSGAFPFTRPRITPAADESDPKLEIAPAQVAIEYIAHCCFRLHSPGGTRLLIDPFMSRRWLGYDFPPVLAADAVLITHAHDDHDAGVFSYGEPAPWTPEVRLLREAGSYRVGEFSITGVRGKHSDRHMEKAFTSEIKAGKRETRRLRPDEWGEEPNTIWLLELNGLRIVHFGDNGPPTKSNVEGLGRVDILMLAIDAKEHILNADDIKEIRRVLRPRVVIPMHYRIAELERYPDSLPELGPIDPWLEKQNNVDRLKSNQAIFTVASLPTAERVIVLQHSPKVLGKAKLRPERAPPTYYGGK
jgi:L-ascorbate metabolism protein UlaG (beta-lactamase superfamily)